MRLADAPAELQAKVQRLRNQDRECPAQIEAAGPSQESVWDYPRPPRVEAVRRRVRVAFGGLTLAESTSAYRVLETSGPPVYYMPPRDVRTGHLEPSDHEALCEWKGRARYWSVRVGERFAEDAAWSYPDPWDGFEAIRNHIAFNAGVMDACYVGSDRVTPQPGAYYGGWITPEVVGPFKGVPGSERW
jgi:uncharacterized protein (DUF427 family)